MAFPTPTEKQGRIFWSSITALALGILLALVGLLVWGFGWVLHQLSSVLLPLAVAGIVAYLLDPLVDILERRRIPRRWSIILVFLIGVLVVALMLATVLPRLIRETQGLIDQLPQYGKVLQSKVENLIKDPPLGLKWPAGLQFFGSSTNTTNAALATNAIAPPPASAGQTNQPDATAGTPAGTPSRGALLTSEFSHKFLAGLTGVLLKVGRWLLDQLSKVASWLGLIIGLALVPVYTFYFLLEKKGISRQWTDYLPIHESAIKDELVFVLTSINDYLILFFRGQVLVALCDGVLLTIGFLSIGLNYAVLLGMVAGFLSIIPYLGVMMSLIPALILAAVQFGDWLHPILVLAIFGLVQLLEGLVISPKIMGDRVGLHPLTIIIAVMVGTTLMGGIIGGILAIPLTAALRVLMFRYVWKRRDLAQPQKIQRSKTLSIVS